MMTTNLFVTADVKQLRTDGSFIILLPFFRTSWGVGVLNSAIFNSFQNRVEFGTILESLRNLGGGRGFEPSPVRHCSYMTFQTVATAENSSIMPPMELLSESAMKLTCTDLLHGSVLKLMKTPPAIFCGWGRLILTRV